MYMYPAITYHIYIRWKQLGSDNSTLITALRLTSNNVAVTIRRPVQPQNILITPLYSSHSLNADEITYCHWFCLQKYGCLGGELLPLIWGTDTVKILAWPSYWNKRLYGSTAVEIHLININWYLYLMTGLEGPLILNSPTRTLSIHCLTQR